MGPLETVRQKLTYAHAAMAMMLSALIVIHVGAVIFNRDVRKFAVLELMLPAHPADKLINRTPIAGQLNIE